jgi:hypothetical protein
MAFTIAELQEAKRLRRRNRITPWSVADYPQAGKLEVSETPIGRAPCEQSRRCLTVLTQATS